MRYPSHWSTGIKVASLAALLVGSGAWAVTEHDVTLRVDGVDRTVSTHADNVRGVLASAGLKVGARDALYPSPDAPVRTGETIDLHRARQLKVTLDGQVGRLWVTASTVADALDRLALNPARVKLSAPRSSRLPLTGAVLRIATQKQVTLRADGHTRALTTYADTVKDLLAEQKLPLAAADRVSPAPSATLAGTPAVVVARIHTRSVTETVTVAAPVTTQSDATLPAGQREVRSQGRDGLVRQVVRYVYADGKLTARQVMARTVLTVAEPTVVAQGTQAATSVTAAAASSSASSGTSQASGTTQSSGSGLNWAALAQCESGGRTDAVSPDGTYYGLYQFSVGTWQAMGGTGLPSQASASEQTARANKLYQASGAGQWPVCGSRL